MPFFLQDTRRWSVKIKLKVHFGPFNINSVDLLLAITRFVKSKCFDGRSEDSSFNELYLLISPTYKIWLVVYLVLYGHYFPRLLYFAVTSLAERLVKLVGKKWETSKILVSVLGTMRELIHIEILDNAFVFQ